MPFSAGSTFLSTQTPTVPAHLWMIISETSRTADMLVMVSFTSWRDDKDPSCRLKPGDHPFLKHESCVSYRDAKLVKAADLNRLVRAGLMNPHQELAPDMLQRILQGAAESAFLPEKVRAFLEGQGLI